MDAKEIIKKYWWVGAILLALLLLLRPKQQGTSVSRLAAIEGEAPTSDGIMEQTLQRLSGEEASRASRMGAAQEALAMQQMESQKSLLRAQTDYELSILKGQTIVQQRLAEKASKVQLRCADGKTKLDPITGALFCRKEATKGMSIGGRTIFGGGGILDSFNQLASKLFGIPSGSVFGGGFGTPPIAGGNFPGFPGNQGGPY